MLGGRAESMAQRVSNVSLPAVVNIASFSLKVSMTSPGSTVPLKIFREGGSIELTPTLTELKEKPLESGAARRDAHGPRFGLTVESLNPAILRALGLPANTKGVAVSDVALGSIAEEAGLQMGDIIQEVNRKAVANMAEYDHAECGYHGDVPDQQEG
jgi:serine protease Do